MYTVVYIHRQRASILAFKVTKNHIVDSLCEECFGLFVILKYWVLIITFYRIIHTHAHNISTQGLFIFLKPCCVIIVTLFTI